MTEKLLKGWPGYRFSGFSVISGVGWLIDFATMAGLVQLGLSVGPANFVGASLAVTFVFVLAKRYIFRQVPGRSLPAVIALYWLWQIFAVTAASALIGWLSLQLLTLWDMSATPARMIGYGLHAATLAGILAKLLVTPCTLLCNFLVLRALLEYRHRQ